MYYTYSINLSSNLLLAYYIKRKYFSLLYFEIPNIPKRSSIVDASVQCVVIS